MSAVVRAASGMVASSQRLASQVGVELLRAGGSAVDAAIGVNAMLNLIEPHMCGLGGDLFAQVWDPRTRQLRGLNASGRAPSQLNLEDLRDRVGDVALIPFTHVDAATVPGAVAGWAALHERYGRLPIADIFAPVIAHAQAGVEIGRETALWWHHASAAVVGEGGIGALDAGFRATFLVGGHAPTAGSTFRNEALAHSYAVLARNGFADFYHGELAQALGQYLHACGSAISPEDLANCSAEWVQPISTTYRGCDVFELPPNGQGLCVLQMLNILEQFPLADDGFDSPDYWHLFVEAKKLAFEDRAHFYADPDFSRIPLTALASKGYAQSRAALVGPTANTRPIHGDPALAQSDTTYLSVADADGMMVSLIQSIYAGFGCGLAPPALGFAVQSRGAGFSLNPAHPNVYAAGKRPFHTIIPAFVCREGEPWMSFGVMGADMQPQGQVQILINMLDFGMDLQAAGDAARMRHDGMNGPNITQVSDAGIVWHEASCNPAVLAELSARGHDVRPASHPVWHFMGGYQCVRRESVGWSGASESRFDGAALGY